VTRSCRYEPDLNATYRDYVVTPVMCCWFKECR
jgi:hypothetical protein